MPTVPTTRRRRGRGTHRSDSGPTPGVRSRQLTRRRTINSARAPRNSVRFTPSSRFTPTLDYYTDLRFTPSSDIHRSGVQRKFTPSPDLHHPQIYTIPNLHHPRCTCTLSPDWHHPQIDTSKDCHWTQILTCPQIYTVFTFTPFPTFTPSSDLHRPSDLDPTYDLHPSQVCPLQNLRTTQDLHPSRFTHPLFLPSLDLHPTFTPKSFCKQFLACQTVSCSMAHCRCGLHNS